MIDLDEIASRYASERPAYDALAVSVRDALRGALLRAGIMHRAEGRAKEPSSLVKKAVLRQKSYEEIGDKAGARIVLAQPTDRARAVEIIRSAANVVAEEDKREMYKPGEFGYSGVHFEVESVDGLRCEVQLHTPGEAVWASVVHDMSYKSVLPVPRAAQRSLFRMRALTEIFDEEVSRVSTDMESLMNTPAAAALEELEPRFLRLAKRPYNTGLSVRVLDQLLVGEVFNDISGLSRFCDENEKRFRQIFVKYAESLNPLLTQPEAMLIFYLLEKDPFAVREAWEGLPQGVLHDFEAIWGVIGDDN
jgi:ppGpp synthetase/RelA/SpoT-type nucleotidyltranferase